MREAFHFRKELKRKTREENERKIILIYK